MTITFNFPISTGAHGRELARDPRTGPPGVHITDHGGQRPAYDQAERNKPHPWDQFRRCKAGRHAARRLALLSMSAVPWIWPPAQLRNMLAKWEQLGWVERPRQGEYHTTTAGIAEADRIETWIERKRAVSPAGWEDTDIRRAAGDPYLAGYHHPGRCNPFQGTSREALDHAEVFRQGQLDALEVPL